MTWKIEIQDKSGIFDAVGEGVRKDILDLGIKTVEGVTFVQVYEIEGKIAAREVTRICAELLADPVSQEYRVNPPPQRAARRRHVVEIAYNPGVMDPVEESALKAIRDMGITGVSAVRTARKFILSGALTAAQLKTLTEKLLCNKLIQHVVDPQRPVHPFAAARGYQFSLTTVEIVSASDRELMRLSRQGQLFLNLAEMKHIRRYFKLIRRNPTDCELETIAQTWSEHCMHKTFRGKIDYTEKVTVDGRTKRKRRVIDNLLKSTIARVTRELNKPWCVSVFHDNSGVIRFDERNNVCFKVETHNHPSALEPFGGANTGIGGVIRDPMGTGLGARPVLNTDVFCFAPPDYPFSKLPAGTLHPKRIAKGVVSGVRDYGNKMGIPTVNGAVLFDEGFVGNPLVYCGTVGIMPRDKSFKKVSSGELIVVLGGRTGRDGIHGATFSSGELTHESETISSGAVQIGNPIQEKKVLDVLMQARDLGLYTAITDCGAGGLSSAVGEMGQDTGARVDLEKVPLKYSGLSYTEIWISESQERMVVSVPRRTLERLLEVFAAENVEATVIGEFTDTGRLQLFYQGNPVCDLDMKFLHEGVPLTAKKAVYVGSRRSDPRLACPADLTPALSAILSDYSVCSKEWVVRQYDHEVQGGSVIKPLVGLWNDGPSDAAVVRPVLGSDRGIVVSNGINFRYGFIDPYWMAAGCIDEALRQIIAVGGTLKEVAILDNFCWGNPDKPDRLGGLVRAAIACYDIARGFGVPFISGKDSLYNEYTAKGASIAIPGTLLISAIAVMEDVRKAVSMFAKEPHDLIYVVGQTADELGGSQYLKLSGALGASVPRVNVKQALLVFNALSRAAERGLVRAMHDCSDGGIAVAAAEMAFAGGLGLDMFLTDIPYKGTRARRNDYLLFSESHSRFLVEVSRQDQKKFEQCLAGVPLGLIGCTAPHGGFTVYGLDGKACVKSSIHELKEAWKRPLRW